MVPNTQYVFISRPRCPIFCSQQFKRLVYYLVVMGHTRYLLGRANLAWFHLEWAFLLCQRWLMQGDLVCAQHSWEGLSSNMWDQTSVSFNDKFSRVDLCVVYRHNVDRNFISVWRGHWEGVNAANCCSMHADTRAVPSQTWCETWAGCTLHKCSIVITADLTGLAF